MKPTLLKLTLAACAAMVAAPTFAQPEAAATDDQAKVAMPAPSCRCPGQQMRRFRSLMLARRWAASVRCGHSYCPRHRPCLKNVTIRRAGYMVVATVRCRCRLL
ncbi:MAG: hypothetical protein QOH04_1147 [Sphingomonadales bacterium]|jgi:hypothetical protein|nr:hypothetical protein [Sphingomonadales bacterium]MEA3035385.1 hypothetical protein [Sphingomonadales bacterium]